MKIDKKQVLGLTSEEAVAARAAHGANVIPESEPTTFREAFMETFEDPMIRILLVIVVIMLGMYALGQAEIYEPVGTVVAVLIVAFVTAKTSVASDTKYRELRASSKNETAKVHRDGRVEVLSVDDVVVGDYVLLQAGDKVPADGVLVTGALRVNNAALNGEAEECPKTAAAEGTPFPEKVAGDTFVDPHTLFRGAVVFDGEGVVRIDRVGTKTMMGQMAEEMNGDEPDSPLKVKLTKLAEQISTFGYASAVVIVLLYMAYFVVTAGGVGAYLDQSVAHIVMDVVSAVSLAILIVVCAVPEGLPLMISLVLMQNTSRMLDHNVLVRKAIGIETAGSLNILFSDKTGTITKGQLEVVEFFTGGGDVVPLDKLMATKAGWLTAAAVAKNTASMFDGEHRVIGGNATDQALMRFVGEDVAGQLTDEVGRTQSFNSANKFSQAELPAVGRVLYKGAPERLLAKARRCVTADGQVVDLDTGHLNGVIDGYAKRAMRVIAFGYSESPFTENVVNDDLVLVGLVAIRDDVRPEAREAIAAVQQAGVQVVMITGDRLETAVAIARDAGLMHDGELALTSAQLNELSDDQVKTMLPNIRVIARALPTDKSRVVRLSQELNLVVGMTGDGVNDSPALARADVGFAMGSGTEAAKEAGEIVILDDNFRSIKDAILYGRTIYHNILKFCRFQLMINVAAVVVSAVSPFFGVVEPLKVVHLLFINLVMDSLGAIMLGNEPALAQYMHEPPRRRDESIVSREMAAQILTVAGWVTLVSFAYLKLPVFANLFENQAQLYTSFFVFFVAAALMNGFNVRDEGRALFNRLGDNPGFMRVWVAILAVQALIVNAALVPFEPLHWVSEMFSCTPFPFAGWVTAFALAATVIPVDLLRKTLCGRAAAADHNDGQVEFGHATGPR